MQLPTRPLLHNVSRVPQTQHTQGKLWCSPPPNCSSSSRIPYLKECLRYTQKLGTHPQHFLPLHHHPSQIPTRFSLLNLWNATSTAAVGIRAPFLSHLDNWCPCIFSCLIILLHTLGSNWSFQAILMFKSLQWLPPTLRIKSDSWQGIPVPCSVWPLLSHLSSYSYHAGLQLHCPLSPTVSSH